MNDEFKIKIGLETHIQLNSKSKLFCGCPNPVNLKNEAKPNTIVCETCLGLPGSKPRVNKKVVELAAKVALAMKCEISPEMFFSRKTYFYPDMNKNFQITQYEIPLAHSGAVEINGKKIRVTRIHIEEDPAKIIHVGGLGGRYTQIDYNRAGIPLIEIVTEPDFSSPEEARAYLQKLAMIVEYLGVYDSSSEAAIKTDANISINGNERVEVKNITGTKEIERALRYEIIRQKNLIKGGGRIRQETRAWLSERGITKLMRTKEEEAEYGYIFEPDLTKIEITEPFIEKMQKGIPELPDEKKERFVKRYKISKKLAESLVSDQDIANLFEDVAKSVKSETAASWLAGPLLKTLNYNNKRLKDAGLKKEWIIALLKKFERSEYTDVVTEQILRKMVEEKKSPDEIIKKYKFAKAQAADISGIIEKVLKNNPKAVKDYKSGEKKAIFFLIGQVIKESKGAIDANRARKELLKKMD